MTESSVVSVVLYDATARTITLRINNPKQELTLATIRSALEGLFDSSDNQYGFVSRYGFHYQGLRSATYEVTSKTSIS